MMLQLAYNLYQDRLLLTIGLAETPAHGFWLTRRMTLLLWHALTKQLASSVNPVATVEAQAWLLSMQHEAATARFVPTAEPALTLTVDPVLVSTLQYGQHEDGRQVLSLLDDQGRGQTYAMPAENIHALLHLIEQKTIEAGWGLDLAWPDGGVVASLARTLQ